MGVKIEESKSSKKEGLVQSQGKGFTEVKHPNGITETKHENVMTVLTSDHPANVTLAMSHTKNLGNYESARVEVRLTLPCDPHIDAIEFAYAQADKWVNEKMAENVSDLEGK